MEVLGHQYNPHRWRFLIDSSKVSLKVVLLHDWDRFLSIPLAHATNMKETYESMKLLLGKLKYVEFRWKLCDDLKIVALLLRKQLWCTKYCCFLCEWNNRYKKSHFVNKLLPIRKSLTPGEKNVVTPPLVLPDKIYLPPFAHKVGSHKKVCEKCG
jgi:hypothetical protein